MGCSAWLSRVVGPGVVVTIDLVSAAIAAGVVGFVIGFAVGIFCVSIRDVVTEPVIQELRAHGVQNWEDLRMLASQIEKYGTSHSQIVLTRLAESQLVEALRFQADALEKAGT